jgi:flagellar assembly protein FliH
MHNVLEQIPHATLAIFPELVRRGTAPTEMGARTHATLEQVERQAQTLMEAARRKAAALMEAGHREGTVQGRAEALAHAEKGLQELAASVKSATERLQALETACRARADEMVVTLALAVAERVLHAEIARDPAAMLPVVRNALALLPSPGDVVIRIHPDAVALLQAHRDALQDAFPDAKNLRIVGDPVVSAGGCMVDTPHSLVDATFPTQLDEARRRLREEAW